MIKQQVLWSSRGISQTNDAAVFVYDYLRRKTLSRLGYTSNIDELSEEDTQIIMLIDNEFAKVEADAAKRNGRMKQPRRR